MVVWSLSIFPIKYKKKLTIFQCHRVCLRYARVQHDSLKALGFFDDLEIFYTRNIKIVPSSFAKGFYVQSCLFPSLMYICMKSFQVFKTQESLEKLKIRSSSRQCSSCAKYPTELHKRWNRKFCFLLLCLFSLLAHTLVHLQLWTGSKDYWKSWTAGNFHFHVRTFVFSDTLIRSLSAAGIKSWRVEFALSQITGGDFSPIWLLSLSSAGE